MEPGAATRIILHNIYFIENETELDLTDDERAAWKELKKKFAEDMVAAVRGSWGSIRQILETKRAEARETQKQWIKKRKVDIVEIGLRIDETPDVSKLSDIVEAGPITEQQAIRDKEIWPHPSRKKLDAARPARTTLTHVVQCGKTHQQSSYDVLGYVETQPSRLSGPVARF